jgi:alkanesulfonate monooxygenase
MNLKFHWMLPKAGEVDVDSPQTPYAASRYRIESTRPTSPATRPDMKGWVHFAQRAEKAGIDSVLISFSRYEPDPLVVACALGQATKQLKFISAYRAGLMQPTTFVQQVNTVSALTQGRISLNVVVGSSTVEQHGYGDYLAHDDRYRRAEEFLEICHSFWRRNGDVSFEGNYYRLDHGKILTPFVASGQTSPEIYVSGHSERAEELACTQGTCWLRVIETPETLQPVVERARARGVRVCLRLGLICRPTYEEALRTLEELVPADKNESTTTLKDDSQMYREGANLASDKRWLSRSLWVGFVKNYGPVWTTLLGTPQEIADAFIEYKKIGVSEFIISGWPEVDEVDIFGRDVLPLVREAEQRL